MHFSFNSHNPDHNLVILEAMTKLAKEAKDLNYGTINKYIITLNNNSTNVYKEIKYIINEKITVAISELPSTFPSLVYYIHKDEKIIIINQALEDLKEKEPWYFDFVFSNYKNFNESLSPNGKMPLVELYVLKHVLLFTREFCNGDSKIEDMFRKMMDGNLRNVEWLINKKSDVVNFRFYKSIFKNE
jgi:hypothetical protein